MRRPEASPGTLLRAALLTAGVFAVIAFGSCGGRLKEVGGKNRFVEGTYWNDVKQDYQDYGGFYELKERKTLIEWERGHWATTTDLHSVIVVLDAKKMEEYADFSIDLPPDARLTVLEAATISADGEVTEVRDFYDKSSAPGFMLFSESREKVFAMPRFEDRCVLDVKYQIQTSGPDLDDGFWFGAAIPVKKSAYSYVVSSALTDMCDLKYKCYNFPTRAPEEMVYRTINDVVHEFAWEMEDVSAFPREDWMPPVERYVPRIQLTGEPRRKMHKGWDGFTEWYHGVLEDYCDLPGELRERAHELEATIEDPAARLDSVTSMLAEDYRYVAIDLGTTRWKPNRPEDVYTNRYGDCKDLSMLAICMLREAGLKACPALMLTKDRGEIDLSVPVPRFNHMIVYVEDLDTWMDPTLGQVPPGVLHYSERGVPALLIKGESAVWKQTPAVPLFPARRYVETLLTVMSDGTVVGNSKVTYEGDFAVARLQAFQSATEDEIAEKIREAGRQYVTDASIQSCKLVALRDDPPGIEAVAHFSRPRTAFKLEDRIALRLDFLKPLLFRAADEFDGAVSRRYDVSFPHTWSEIETIAIDIPSGWEIAGVPDPAESTGYWGTFRIEYGSTDSQIIVRRILALSRTDLDLARLDEFTGFWEEAESAAGREIILKEQS